MIGAFFIGQTMALLDRITALFRRSPITSSPTTQPTLQTTLMEPPPRPTAAFARFEVENTRRAIVTDCQRMVEDDPRVEGILAAVARDVMRNGFELVVDGPRADEAKAIALETLNRVRFFKRAGGWILSSMRDGDTFLELVVDSRNQIASVSRKPALELHRWSDDFDQFFDVTKAFYWTDVLWSAMAVPAEATWFAEWQMIHARWNFDENRRYGRPMFASARKAYKRTTEGELDIAIRRKTRAGMKYVHALEGANEGDVETYKARNKAALQDPFAAVADFFSNQRTSIQAIQGDAHLSEIDDVMHHLRTFWVASPVPMSLLGYGQDLNRDVLDEQKKQYDATKEILSGWVADEMVAPLIERAWLLAGIWPEGLSWHCEWTAPQAMTAPLLTDVAKALGALRATALFRDETLIRLFSRFWPEFDAQSEIDALAELGMEGELGRIAGVTE